MLQNKPHENIGRFTSVIDAATRHDPIFSSIVFHCVSLGEYVDGVYLRWRLEGCSLEVEALAAT